VRVERVLGRAVAVPKNLLNQPLGLSTRLVQELEIRSGRLEKSLAIVFWVSTGESSEFFL
jgi:hypothetical protein